MEDKDFVPRKRTRRAVAQSPEESIDESHNKTSPKSKDVVADYMAYKPTEMEVIGKEKKNYIFREYALNPEEKTQFDAQVKD